MTALDSLLSVADRYDAIVFDQWGVLHDGSTAYPQAVETLAALRARGHRLAVLSNSGKRAEINRARIAGMGFEGDGFEVVMTSGEALWRDMQTETLSHLTTLLPITAAPGDAEAWARDLSLRFTGDVAGAEGILLMGLPDGGDHGAIRATLDAARARHLPLICSNPDRASPRAGGVTVISPGALAHDYGEAGGEVTFYGKPHLPIFAALQSALGIADPARILMVGDSPEHDIAGAHGAGWHALFIAGGLHAAATEDLFARIAPPHYTLPTLR
ncbi:TIGR01459 family HAD-type hydrolase [Dinoroseobacter sp. S124A]|uniref:TIGR01459 family HAD-type hydrolase n=1 Tax=Dinoroseobacter sp. S124A TaxID=3415128 RepID=UPI003C7ED0F6